MAKKMKTIENFGSYKEDSIERSSKKGCKSLKKIREEETERLKMKGIQGTIDMSISRNTRAIPSKGGPLPSSNIK